MLESDLTPNAGSSLPSEGRLRLFQTLASLPSAQFEEIIFALNPPRGNLPGSSASQSQRSKALLEWAESPIGNGLRTVENLLDRVAFKDIKNTENYHAFAITGKVSSSSLSEVKAIIQLLRRKTGDDSLDFVFYEEGSIRIIIRGKRDSIDEIEDLFDWNELDEIEPSVEYVRKLRANTPSFRKARLIRILKMLDASLSLARSRTLSSANELIGYLVDHLSSSVEVSSKLLTAVEKFRVQAEAVESSNRGKREIIPEVVFTRFSDQSTRTDESLRRSQQNVGRLKSSFRKFNLNRINNSYSLRLTKESVIRIRDILAEVSQAEQVNESLPFDSVASIPDSSRTRPPFFSTALAYLSTMLALSRLYPPTFLLSLLVTLGTGAYVLYDKKFGNNVNTARKLSEELSQILVQSKFIIRELDNELSRVLDSSDAPNFTNADLRGANLGHVYIDSTLLEGADFTNADVFGTCFRDDALITMSDRSDLQSRGAIFIDLTTRSA